MAIYYWHPDTDPTHVHWGDTGLRWGENLEYNVTDSLSVSDSVSLVLTGGVRPLSVRDALQVSDQVEIVLGEPIFPVAISVSDTVTTNCYTRAALLGAGFWLWLPDADPSHIHWGDSGKTWFGGADIIQVNVSDALTVEDKLRGPRVGIGLEHDYGTDVVGISEAVSIYIRPLDYVPTLPDLEVVYWRDAEDERCITWGELGARHIDIPTSIHCRTLKLKVRGVSLHLKQLGVGFDYERT